MHASLDAHGNGVSLRDTSSGAPVDAVAVRAATGTRPRRDGANAVVTFEGAARLLDDPGVTWDATARKSVENRCKVSSSADAVIEMAKQIVDGEPTFARGLVEDSQLAARLDPHQVVNLAVLTIPEGWGGCIFDEQGTGKTITMIATFDLLVERGQADVLLVVCPKTMANEWAAEFSKFTGDLYRVVVAADGPRRARAAALDAGADVLVINYETAVSLRSSLIALARRCKLVLAIDESFFVKNPGAGRTAAIAEIREWCVRAYALCGTPAPNAPADLVTQFDLIDFGHAFRHTSLTGDRADDLEPVRRASRARGVYVRNLKDTVLDLPGRTFSDVLVPLAPAQQAAYDSLRDDLVRDLNSVDDATFVRDQISYLARRSQLLRLCSDPGSVISGHTELPAKDAALDDLLAEMITAKGEKVVLWSFYRASLERLARRYKEYGLVRIDGSVTDTAMRRQAVRLFQEDSNTRIFLGNPAAAGAGITLHAARIAVFESASSQAAHYLQSLDRIHRRGQGREVEYVTLLARGTLEEVEYRRLRDKAAAQAELLGDSIDQPVTRELLLEELLSPEAIA